MRARLVLVNASLPDHAVRRLEEFMEQARRNVSATKTKIEILPRQPWEYAVRRELVALARRTGGRWPGRRALRRVARRAGCRVRDVERVGFGVWPLIAREEQEARDA